MAKNTKKPKSDDGDDDDDNGDNGYLVCPKCGYSMKLKGMHDAKKEILCKKCGAPMVKSKTKTLSPKEFADGIALICSKIRRDK